MSNQALTPSQLDHTTLLDKRLSGSELNQSHFANSTLSNDYRGYTSIHSHNVTASAVGNNGVRLNSSSNGGLTTTTSQWRA